MRNLVSGEGIPSKWIPRVVAATGGRSEGILLLPEVLRTDAPEPDGEAAVAVPWPDRILHETIPERGKRSGLVDTCKIVGLPSLVERRAGHAGVNRGGLTNTSDIHNRRGERERVHVAEELAGNRLPWGQGDDAEPGDRTLIPEGGDECAELRATAAKSSEWANSLVP